MTFNLSLWKDRQMNPPTYLHGHSLKEVYALEFLGLTISHDFPWYDDIAKLPSRVSQRLGILC